MIETLLFVALALLLGVIALLVVLLQRRPTTDFSPVNTRLDAVDKAQERTERAVREEIARNREEGAGQARGLREEMLATLNAFTVQLAGTAQTYEQKLEAMRLTLEAQLKSLVEDNGRRLEQIRQDATATARLNRDEGAIAMKSFNDSVVKIMGEMAARQLAQLDAFSTQLAKLTESNAKKFEELRAIVETRLAQIQADNTNKLEEMRRTVDEKLQGTLERRLVLQFFLDLPG